MSAKHSYLDFDRLKSITIIRGTLVNETPLRVGVGREPPLGSAIDTAVIRLRRGDEDIPYIPGSSLKGVFRTFVEQLLRSADRDVHSPWDLPDEEKDKQNPSPCVVCGIFGNTAVASHVRIYDALPEVNPRKFVKTGVSIDRDFGGQRPGLLYTEEFVPPGTEWNLRMEVLNIDFPSNQSSGDERVYLLDSLVKTLKTVGLQVGARRSVGAGLIKLRQARWERYSPVNGMLEKIAEGAL